MDEKNNEKVKAMIRKKRLKQWEVAKEIGMSETYFCKLLRSPIDEELEQKIYDAIDSILAEE